MPKRNNKRNPIEGLFAFFSPTVAQSLANRSFVLRQAAADDAKRCLEREAKVRDAHAVPRRALCREGELPPETNGRKVKTFANLSRRVRTASYFRALRLKLVESAQSVSLSRSRGFRCGSARKRLIRVQQLDRRVAERVGKTGSGSGVIVFVPERSMSRCLLLFSISISFQPECRFHEGVTFLTSLFLSRSQSLFFIKEPSFMSGPTGASARFSRSSRIK